MLKIYDSLAKKKREFIPIKGKEVSIYSCGITPYKSAHLGHAMQAVFFDVIRRYLEYKGFKVKYVRNYTDIDDKIVKFAKQKKLEPLTYAEKMISKSEAELKLLGVRSANSEPKVSEYIDEIINFIKLLINKDYGYVTSEGNVYFSVRKFKEYGKLSGQSIDSLESGVRKMNCKDKKDPLDFALWKHEDVVGASWDSPWGKGRPGWHIECSAMSLKNLGFNFDIHGGGRDLIFPHHENEIAQSEAAYGKFANYWVHNGLLMVGNEKMSKSLNNYSSLESWLHQYHPQVIWYMIVSSHYRSNIELSSRKYKEANKKVHDIYTILKAAEEFVAEKKAELDENLLDSLYRKFSTAMDNDFNTPEVLGLINIRIKKLMQYLADKEASRVATELEFIRNIGKVIGLFYLDPRKVLIKIEQIELSKIGIDKKDIEQVLTRRNSARKKGNYDLADKLREELERKGLQVLDYENSSEVRIRF